MEDDQALETDGRHRYHRSVVPAGFERAYAEHEIVAECSLGENDMRGLLIALALAGSAWAHHSMSGFERTKTVTLTGTIKQFKWANPHCWIEMEVPNSKGGSDIWNVEVTA